DFHALPRAELNFLDQQDSARSTGDSMRSSFQQHGWERDLQAKIPFRVVVRKFRGNTQIDFDGDARLIVEVKDPPDESTQGSGTRQQFMQTFLGTPRGADNADVAEGGIRGRSFPAGLSGGVVGTDVLATVPFVSPPAADESGRIATVDDAQLSGA